MPRKLDQIKELVALTESARAARGAKPGAMLIHMRALLTIADAVRRGCQICKCKPCPAACPMIDASIALEALEADHA